ncbi:DgyrCDS7606 [Dimorphilus gyrociliatus]|uniref:DgyrCDS7606 n=1 Tax=Dimorphilus gyrociliatus TaxID=2664684 RepID=A0A7I8VRI8_9ANNE|nr:DgyrCDS7606 [Dimorphilus gyrociliatus]
MHSKLDSRPYWCISRQRSWGLPIPVFYEKETNQPFISKDSVQHLRELVKKYGSDCWWSMDIEELLPKSIREKGGFRSDTEFVKGSDILDIWFDSGSSWYTVLPENIKQADVYLEGIDQFGGWFQSSLITSVAQRDIAPYKKIIAHGFVVDEDGKKMSKSLGNVIDPANVVEGANDSDLGYGADVLRWWVALSHEESKVLIGKSLLKKYYEQIFKVRKTLRYLLGNLADFELDKRIEVHEMLPQDRYMMHLLSEFIETCRAFYDAHEYKKVVLSLERFINGPASAFYCRITKDRIYCSSPESKDRRSAQTVQFHIADEVLKILAPVLPFLTEEVSLYHPFDKLGSIFKRTWTDISVIQSWKDDRLAEKIQHLLHIRDSFNSFIASEDPVEFDLILFAQGHLFSTLKSLQSYELHSATSPICEILQPSNISLLSKPPVVIPDEAHVVEGVCKNKENGKVFEDRYLLLIVPAEGSLCERCRKYTSVKQTELCLRCSTALTDGWE